MIETTDIQLFLHHGNWKYKGETRIHQVDDDWNPAFDPGIYIALAEYAV
jgi:hypothetical protein